jgi:hypothetical protein
LGVAEQMAAVEATRKEKCRLIPGERRHYLRRKDHFRVELRPFRDESAHVPEVLREGAALVGFSRDISVSGMALAVPEALPLGYLLKATVHVPELHSPLVVVGEVIRCARLSKSGFDLGLRYVPHWIGESEREALLGLLYD